MDRWREPGLGAMDSLFDSELSQRHTFAFRTTGAGAEGFGGCVWALSITISTETSHKDREEEKNWASAIVFNCRQLIKAGCSGLNADLAVLLF